MTINIGDDIYVLGMSGGITDGIFTGEKSEGMYGVTMHGMVHFKRMKDIFLDRETAEARWFVRKYKRLAAMGHSINEIINTNLDEERFSLARDLWPEDIL